MLLYFSYSHGGCEGGFCIQRIVPSEICAVVGFYTVQNGSFLLTFWDNLLVPSSRVKESKEKCFLLDIPEHLNLMFLHLIAVLIFCLLPQLHVGY
jgi:hypothetical protein